MNGKSQHGFTQGKSRLCDLNISLKKVTGFVDEERPVRVIYLTLSQAFGNVLRNILVPKLGCYSLGGWRTRWLKSRLHGQAQRVVISVLPSIWRLAASGIPLVGSFPVPVLLGIFTSNLEEVMKCTLISLRVGRDNLEGRATKQRDLNRLY